MSEATQPEPAATPAENRPAAQPVSAADLVAADRDGFPGEPILPAASSTPEAAGNGDGAQAATSVSALELVEADRDEMPSGDAAPRRPGSGRPRLPDTPERIRQRERDAKRRPPKHPRPPASGPAPAPEPPPPELPPKMPPPPTAQVDYNALALRIVKLGTGALVMFLGPEWQPQKGKVEVRMPDGSTVDVPVDEEGSLVSAVADYMRAKGMPDIPPGLMLTLVLMSYAAPRLTVPNTKTRIRMMWDATLGRLFKRRKKAGEPAPMEEKK